MVYLYGTGLAYGIGVGSWIDILAKAQDPGVIAIAPILFGAGIPAGFFLWDYIDTFRPGVPASLATGLWLGFLEGVAISGTQVALSSPDRRWDLPTAASITFATTTAGGVGGFFFGRWLEPDPRGVAFIAEGMGWGAATGLMMGIGASADGKGSSEKSSGDGAAVGTLLGANLGIAATATMVIAGYQPSWNAQKWMWLGYTVGAAAPSFLYLFYIGQNDKDPKHGLVANALGGVAGLTFAAILAGGMSDEEPMVPRSGKAYKPPFNLLVTPPDRGQGGILSAVGTW